MKKRRFIESQIEKALKEYETVRPPEDICRELEINRVTFYNWKKKYGGMELRLTKPKKEHVCSQDLEGYVEG